MKVSDKRRMTGTATARSIRATDHLWLGTPLFVVLWRNLQFPLPLLDFWWHLKMGQLIVTTGSIPDTDLFSLTATGRPYVLQNWLAEVAYYGVYVAGGIPLLVFFNALVALAAFVPVYYLCLRATPRLRLAAAVSLLAALGIPPTVRPQIFSYLMFALFYWILMSYRRREQRFLWALPVLTAMWANLHGAFPIGMLLVAAVLGFELFKRMVLAAADALTFTELRRLAIVFACCVIATLANPEGYEIYAYVRTVMSDPAVQQFVTEWQPPRIDSPAGILVFYLPWFFTTLAFVYARSKPDLTDMGLFLGFGILGLASLRNGPWFSIVAYPLLARYASDIDVSPIFASGRAPTLEGASAGRARPSVKQGARARLTVLFGAAALVVLALQTPWIRPAVYGASLVQRGTPVGAMDFISKHHLTGNIFHPQMFGDYLIWRLWPEQKSFIDGRVHLFGSDFINEYVTTYQAARWDDLVRKWDIRYLLLSKDAGQRASLEMARVARESGQWTTLYEDDVSVLLEYAKVH